MARLGGKVAFITGGGSGIGRAHRRALRAGGRQVVVADINVAAARAAPHRRAYDTTATAGSTSSASDAQRIDAADTRHRGAGGVLGVSSSTCARSCPARSPSPTSSRQQRLGRRHELQRGAYGAAGPRLLHGGQGRHRLSMTRSMAVDRRARSGRTPSPRCVTMTAHVKRLMAANEMTNAAAICSARPSRSTSPTWRFLSASDEVHHHRPGAFGGQRHDDFSTSARRCGPVRR